ncbi:response regulator [Merismopedia glauca]|uniref:Two-component system response regulator n=1 Tax=Merismopedia glauca CCAP 1448/3 TaxID=1296344 RepID=A0A2T1CAD3_9CYAN|nr:response regulator [Merismopedia glauca]PSB05236.1 two-component system response regulator [Merismopedia glauca CCAP 1448/3]
MAINNEHRLTNILLVEDDEVDIMNVKRAFKRGNIDHPLYIANNGFEALQMLLGTSSKISQIPLNRRLILLDLNMPKMGGIEFLRQLRANSHLKSIPVVVLTTSNQDRDLVEAYELNVAGYLLKPVSFSKFVEMMLSFTHYWEGSEIPNK